jgi:hypothetical protein
MLRRTSILAVIAFTGCHFGRVEQGRVVEYDAKTGVLTVIHDSNYRQPGKPKFDVLPAQTVRVPTDPDEMGQAPDSGRLLAIDREARQLVFFDVSAGAFRTIQYTPVSEHAADRRSAAYPFIDRKRKVITVYDPAVGVVVSFAATDEQLALPAETWKAGDEVRYYFKQPGQAVRLMNVTKTDIRRSGH